MHKSSLASTLLAYFYSLSIYSKFYKFLSLPTIRYFTHNLYFISSPSNFLCIYIFSFPFDFSLAFLLHTFFSSLHLSWLIFCGILGQRGRGLFRYYILIFVRFIYQDRNVDFVQNGLLVLKHAYSSIFFIGQSISSILLFIWCETAHCISFNVFHVLKSSLWIKKVI